MADKQFRLILKAAEMLESEEQRSEGNASEDETDSECEEEETASQSDSSLTAREAGGRGAGRKRMFSETTDQFSPTPDDAKYKQASNLHNERERERRKDLKQAVHRLRNQLQTRKTKKATTISVLKASEQEIKDLLRVEADQNRELEKLQNRQKHLTWKLESLTAEQDNQSSNTETGSDTLPVPVPPPLPPTPPAFYLPTPLSAAQQQPAARAPSLHPHPHPVLMQIPRTATACVPSTAPPRFPFGLPQFGRFQPPVIYPFLPTDSSPPHLLNFTAPIAFSPHHSPHPSPLTPFFMMPSTSPQSFTLPPLLPHLPPTVVSPARLSSQFTFPAATTATSFSPSHIPPPSSFPVMLHSVPPSGPLTTFPMFSQYGARLQDASAAAAAVAAYNSENRSPSTWASGIPKTASSSPTHFQQRGNSPSQSEQSLEASESSPYAPSNRSRFSSSSQLQAEQYSRSSFQLAETVDAGSNRVESNIEGSGEHHLIDVESTDQEEEEEEEIRRQRKDRDSFLDVRNHRKQPSKHKRNAAEQVPAPSPPKRRRHSDPNNDKEPAFESKNLHGPPALVKHAGVTEYSTVSQVIKRVEPATRVITKDAFTSALQKQRIFLDSTDSWSNINGVKRRAKKNGQISQQTSSSPVMNAMPHPTPVICS